MAFDLDTLQQTKPVLNTKRAYGVAIDPVSNHGFASGKPVVMWDLATSETIKTIDVPGDPYHDILFESLTEHIFVFNHPVPSAPPSNVKATGAPTPGPTVASAAGPSVTVLAGKDGSIVGTFDLDGAPEQAVSDGQGRLFIDLKDKDSVAVVDVKTLKVMATYSLGGKGRQPCGIGLDAKNHILFVFCLETSNAVILDAANGKFLEALPLGRVPEVGGFNPQSMEAFSSQGDGTLTIIKEKSPTSFMVEQTLTTFTHGRTCTLDTKTNHIIVIAPEHLDKPAASGPSAAAVQASVPTASGTASPTAAASPPASTGNSGASGGAGPAVKAVNHGVALHIFVVGR